MEIRGIHEFRSQFGASRADSEKVETHSGPGSAAATDLGRRASALFQEDHVFLRAASRNLSVLHQRDRKLLNDLICIKTDI